MPSLVFTFIASNFFHIYHILLNLNSTYIHKIEFLIHGIFFIQAVMIYKGDPTKFIAFSSALLIILVYKSCNKNLLLITNYPDLPEALLGLGDLHWHLVGFNRTAYVAFHFSSLQQFF